MAEIYDDMGGIIQIVEAGSIDPGIWLEFKGKIRSQAVNGPNVFLTLKDANLLRRQLQYVIDNHSKVKKDE